ncbi:MAG: NAD(P)H-dependent oxidoreductase subunit E [Deltaproteobacteria bacterium]|jgi:NADH-quinone oxidoreductase subunit E|nr:NAD(P)H-dependent oxidoreductase subunit E [Deltaproteobacteria bacterium]
MSQELSAQLLDEIIGAHQNSPSAVIAILQDIQERYHYIPKAAFAPLAHRVGVSEASIYSVVTFYENFSLEPKGRFIFKVCDGTACHVRKSTPILERLRKELSLASDEVTTADLNFTVETVSCLGACGLAPVLTVNDKVYPAMTPSKVSTLLAELKEELSHETN